MILFSSSQEDQEALGWVGFWWLCSEAGSAPACSHYLSHLPKREETMRGVFSMSLPTRRILHALHHSPLCMKACMQTSWLWGKGRSKNAVRRFREYPEAVPLNATDGSELSKSNRSGDQSYCCTEVAMLPTENQKKHSHHTLDARLCFGHYMD